MMISNGPARRLAFLTGMLLLALASAAGVHAQEGGPPPWPLLYSGSATLDGRGIVYGSLTVRVGDWESSPVTLVDGAFACCLVVGPPDGSYVGQAVTFHLDGRYLGDVSFPFPATASPEERVVELRFFQAVLSPTPTPTPVPTPTLVPTATPEAQATATPAPASPGDVDDEGASTTALVLLIVGGGVGLLAAAALGAWSLYRRR